MILTQVSKTIKELQDENKKLIQEATELCELQTHLQEQTDLYLSSLWVMVLSLQWWFIDYFVVYVITLF